ncbi:hypothetical protein GGX14DRAFT_448768, partial [Mycena pura]
MDVDHPVPSGASCHHQGLSLSSCNSSLCPLSHVAAPRSLTLIREVFLGHHVTRTHTSVFHANLSLHGISHTNLDLVQARRMLIYHLVSGDCAKYYVDSSITPRPDRTSCRVFVQGFDSSSAITQAVLKTVPGITVLGKLNFRFKLRSVLKHI